MIMAINFWRRLYPRLFLCVWLMVVSGAAFAQRTNDRGDAIVDKNGIIRWSKTKEEIKAFGVNYTAMFAHAYRTAQKMNVPLEKAIEDDIYHFARLGFDAFRVHVWDTEISDSTGNLMANENLRLFDFALAKMKERGMKFIITPIAYWGNGWPERDEKTPGFSYKYGKDKCLTDPGCINAQQRYLTQFVNHVNQYTGVAYKNDPDIIAFEVSNEPHHNEPPRQVVIFINKMVDAIRASGTKKPVFYNISHSIHLADAYFESKIQGGTFQWYPTGLGFGRELKGNFLPNVDRYEIPFANHPGFKRSAKIVYEFDAADIGRSYIYPAMARSFRTAGMQIATHFAYDPTFMAPYNTEYGTHYMNLAYAPQKALSLMIASEVFHRVPLYKEYGSYPNNATFDDFRVSYEDDLAELITANTFIYTNNTRSAVPSASTLGKVAGYGTSGIVAYDGSGAYFLDKLEPGVWRLEVMPDAIWTDDPFSKTSLKKTIAVVNWKNWPMKINLPDLSGNFTMKAVNAGNNYQATGRNGQVIVKPGTYLLVKEGVATRIDANSKHGNFRVGEFSAPATSLEQTVVRHDPVEALTEKREYQLTASIYSRDSIESVEIYASAPGSWMKQLPMKRVTGYKFSGTIPADFVIPGTLRYHIVVKSKGTVTTYPSSVSVHPWDWDFYDSDPWSVPVLTGRQPIYLYHAFTDSDLWMRPWIRGSVMLPTSQYAGELPVKVEKLFVPDPENRNAKKISDYSMKLFVGDKLRGRNLDKTKIILRGKAAGGQSEKLQVALTTRSGAAYGATVTLSELRDYEISLGDLRKVSLVSLPRPYPGFLPYFVEVGSGSAFALEDVEGIQISIGPGLSAEQAALPHEFSIESIRLE